MSGIDDEMLHDLVEYVREEHRDTPLPEGFEAEYVDFAGRGEWMGGCETREIVASMWGEDFTLVTVDCFDVVDFLRWVYAK